MHSPSAFEMIPLLPTEILAEILVHLNAGEESVGRQLNRQRVQRVCRNWYCGVDKWFEVAVAGRGKLDGLLDALQADVVRGPGEEAAGLKVRSLYVQLVLDGPARVALGRVIAHTPKLRAIEIAHSGQFGSSLGPILPLQLGRLAELEHVATQALTVPLTELLR